MGVELETLGPRDLELGFHNLRKKKERKRAV